MCDDICSQQTEINSESVVCDKNSAETTLDDAVIEEGDEHTQNITGGPSASILSLENPEATVCIAPCEGEKPMCIHTDTDFELMCNLINFVMGKVVLTLKGQESLHTGSISTNVYWMLMGDLLKT